jgi:hypothetical protein
MQCVLLGARARSWLAAATFTPPRRAFSSAPHGFVFEDWVNGGSFHSSQNSHSCSESARGEHGIGHSFGGPVLVDGRVQCPTGTHDLADMDSKMALVTTAWAGDALAAGCMWDHFFFPFSFFNPWRAIPEPSPTNLASQGPRNCYGVAW